MWGLGIGGGEIEWPTMWRTLCSDGGQLATPPPPHPGGGGVGGREHGCSRPQPHSFGEARCPNHPPWGVGIRLVRGGVCRVSRRSGTGGRHRLASYFALSFFSRGTPVSGGIQELPTPAILGCPRVCPWSLLLGALPQSNNYNNPMLFVINKDCLFHQYLLVLLPVSVFCRHLRPGSQRWNRMRFKARE